MFRVKFDSPKKMLGRQPEPLHPAGQGMSREGVIVDANIAFKAGGIAHNERG